MAAGAMTGWRCDMDKCKKKCQCQHSGYCTGTPCGNQERSGDHAKEKTERQAGNNTEAVENQKAGPDPVQL